MAYDHNQGNSLMMGRADRPLDWSLTLREEERARSAINAGPLAPLRFDREKKADPVAGVRGAAVDGLRNWIKMVLDTAKTETMPARIKGYAQHIIAASNLLEEIQTLKME